MNECKTKCCRLPYQTLLIQVNCETGENLPLPGKKIKNKKNKKNIYKMIQ